METQRTILADESVNDVDIQPEYYLQFYDSYTHFVLLDDLWKCLEILDIIKALEAKKYGVTEVNEQFEMIYHN